MSGIVRANTTVRSNGHTVTIRPDGMIYRGGSNQPCGRVAHYGTKQYIALIGGSQAKATDPERAVSMALAFILPGKLRLVSTSKPGAMGAGR
jgi:hypothetical protein